MCFRNPVSVDNEVVRNEQTVRHKKDDGQKETIGWNRFAPRLPFSKQVQRRYMVELVQKVQNDKGELVDKGDGTCKFNDVVRVVEHQKKVT